MSLYEELGGGDAIQVALDLFYEKVMADPEMIPFFEHVDTDRVKRKQKAFLAMAFGGPNAYDGRSLEEAHRRAVARGLDQERFDAFMGHFRETLRELGVSEPLANRVMDVAYGAQDDVLGRGGHG
jgi:hemoglobin